MQNQCNMQENLVVLQQNLDSNADNTASLIVKLQESQRLTNEEVENLKTAQHSIITQVIPTQQQLVDQIAETTKAIRQGQTELQRTLQAANGQLVQQVKSVSERQQRLGVTTEAIQENGQALHVSHDHLLVKLADFQKTYQCKQEQLDMMKECIATLDSNVMAVLSSLNQFESTLKEDMRGNLAAQNEKTRRVEQTLEQRFTDLNGMLTNVGEVQKTLLILLQDIDKPAKTPDKKTAQASEFIRQKEDKVLASLPSQLSEPQTSDTSVSVPAP
jgi:archaellum component FlaC